MKNEKWQFCALFVWIQTFWDGCDSPLLTIMVRKKAITVCRGLSHTTRSLSRIVCRGQKRPKGRKGTWGLISKPRPRNFFWKPMSPQDTGRQLWGNPGILSLRQFRDNEASLRGWGEDPNKTTAKNCGTLSSLYGVYAFQIIDQPWQTMSVPRKHISHAHWSCACLTAFRSKFLHWFIICMYVWTVCKQE